MSCGNAVRQVDQANRPDGKPAAIQTPAPVAADRWPLRHPHDVGSIRHTGGAPTDSQSRLRDCRAVGC